MKAYMGNLPMMCVLFEDCFAKPKCIFFYFSFENMAAIHNFLFSAIHNRYISFTP